MVPMNEFTERPERIRRAGRPGPGLGFSLGLALLWLFAAVIPAAAGERVTLTLQYPNEPGVVAAWIEEFEALYPHIDVEWQVRPGGDWQSVLITQMIANTAPDVFEFWGAFGQDLARRGLLLDMRPYVERDFTAEEIADFYPVAWESSFTQFGARKGTQYQMPRYINIMVMHYNETHFQEAGLESPLSLDARGAWTWETFREAARKLTRGDGSAVSRWGAVVSTSSLPRMLNWVWGAGGDFFDPEDPTRFIGDEPAAARGIQFLHDLIWQDGSAPAADSGNLFPAGNASIYETGFAEVPRYMDTNPFAWNIVQRPAGPAGRPGYLVDDSFGIWSGTSHPEEAWLLVKFLVSKRGQEILVEKNRIPPVRGSAAQRYFELDPNLNLRAFADAVMDGRPSIISRIAGDVAQVSNELIAMLQSVLRRNEQPYELAVQGAKPRIERIIAETYR